jgi:hypothetical protein
VDFGSGYNAVLITNFLHHFDIATNESLLKKIHAAHGSRGRCGDAGVHPQRRPRLAAHSTPCFSMVMLGTTPHGDAYTFSEYDRMFRNAGFARNEMRELTPLPQRVIVSYK